MRRSLLYCCLLLSFAVHVSFARELRQNVVEAEVNAETNMLGTYKHASRTLSSKPKAWCRGWMTNVESHNIQDFRTTPVECYATIKKYIEKGQYIVDLGVATSQMWTFVSTLKPDGLSAAIMFDIDETLLSTTQIQAAYNYGNFPYNSTFSNAQQDSLTLPALPSSLELYNKLKAAGWKLILITWRSENSRAHTEENLRASGYDGWAELILRTAEYEHLPAAVYESSLRVKLEKEKGYSFKSCAGDQFSDCSGDAAGERTWKFPNPMYYIA